MADDDDLDRLATYVTEHFGFDALKDASSRAQATLTPIDVVHTADAESDDIIEAADGQFYDVDALWHAVRRELERLIGPY
jgi:hypothetical protein